MKTCLGCGGKFRALNSMHTHACVGMSYEEYCSHFGLPKPQLGLSRKKCEVCGQRLAFRGAGRFCAVHDPTRPAMATPFHERYRVVDWGHESPCWEWTGYTERTGYGRCQWRGRATPAHRAFFEYYRGETIPLDLYLDHLCCNRSCVNPDHLEPVTTAVNNKRKRERRFSVAEVFELHNSGWQLRAIAQKFGVSRKTIQNVLYSERYADLRAKYGVQRPQTQFERLESKVPEILRRTAAGEGQKTIAAALEIDVNSVTRVVNAPEYAQLRQELGVVRPRDRVTKEDRIARDVYIAYRRGEGSMYAVGQRLETDASTVHKIVNHPKFAVLREQIDAELRLS